MNERVCSFVDMPEGQFSKMVEVATNAYCDELDVDRKGGIMESVVARGMGALKALGLAA